MQSQVEKAEQSDIPALVELMSQFYAESSYPLDRAWAAASFGQLLSSELRGSAWIARRGTEAAGYVVVTLRHSMEYGGLVAFIDDLFVVANFRRQGIGSALLSTLFEACRKLKVAAAHVEVGSNNVAAEALYGRFGLAGDGRRLLAVDLRKEGHAV